MRLSTFHHPCSGVHRASTLCQIEDYDWVTGDYDTIIGDRWELMKGTWEVAPLNHLGYPLSRIHYFTGYNLDASTDWKWAYIDAAGEHGAAQGRSQSLPLVP